VKVALVTSALEQPTRGNHTTVQRWIANVRGVEVVAVPANPGQELSFQPDVVNGYHALNGGIAARALAMRYGVPLVINLGGTDLFACLRGDWEVTEILESAATITGAFAQFGKLLEESLGHALPYATVPRGVPIPRDLPPREASESLRVLLPAGLRPVKDPMLAIDLAERLRMRGVPLTLKILGPALDRLYADRVRERASRLGFVVVDEAGPEQMARAYLEADVTWNTSLHEGGSNALLEAVAYGCAVYARDITGNRELLTERGAPGVLFKASDSVGLEAYHRALLAETADTRRARVEAGHRWLRRFHDPVAEAEALTAVWRSACT